MSAPNTLSVEKLSRLIGTPRAPVIFDVRIDEDYAADPRSIPGSIRRSHTDVSEWAKDSTKDSAAASAVIMCQKGLKLSQGVAAWLRHSGIDADSLEGGFEAWRQSELPLVNNDKLPPRDKEGRTLWVTRARPKVDRIACPWLIRRFVDPNAVFLFVNPTDVAGVADRFGAVPFDVEGVFWSHRGDTCTFDVMIEELGLTTEPLLRLAAIVRGADTGRLELVPEAAGLLAASLGLSRMYSDDLEQLEAGLTLYDAFFRWCRDATDEKHNWHSAKKPGAAR